MFAPENGYKIIAVLVQELTRAGRGPWCLFRDPLDVGWRVNPIRPVFVATIAQRIVKTPIFATAPQQSDYGRFRVRRGRPQTKLSTYRTVLSNSALRNLCVD